MHYLLFIPSRAAVLSEFPALSRFRYRLSYPDVCVRTRARHNQLYDFVFCVSPKTCCKTHSNRKGRVQDTINFTISCSAFRPRRVAKNAEIVKLGLEQHQLYDFVFCVSPKTCCKKHPNRKVGRSI